jgi:Sushi repeat (SCR repeat)
VTSVEPHSLLREALRTVHADCGYPGLPIDGTVDGITDWHSNAILYRPGNTLTYSCKGEDETLRGTKVRTCQDNGIWSGSRPFCGKLNRQIIERFFFKTGVLGSAGASFSLLIVLSTGSTN